MDVTHEEFQKNYLMDAVVMEQFIKDSNSSLNKNSEKNLNQSNAETDEDEVSQTVTKNIDWRHLMNPAKDQKSCGSCWAFAAMASVEGNLNINFQTQVNLSEQYLVDCDIKDNGCKGGWPSRTFDWLRSNGVVEQTDSPYRAEKNICKLSEFQAKRKNLVKGFESCEKDVRECTKQVWLDLLAKGPVVVAMDASDEGLSLYKPLNGEPWIPAKCEKVNHAVTAVGYVTENDVDYLIVRNSWGANWGIAGYFKVPANKHCGIMDYAWLAEVQNDAPFPVPVCPTFFSQCEFKGKSISSCEGITDFASAIGSKASSFALSTKTPHDPDHYFFTKANCQGPRQWNYQEFTCDAKHWAWKRKPIMSAAPDIISLPWGCIHHLEKTCLTGNKTMICNSISDLAAAGLNLTPGSFYMSNYHVRSVVFFEGPKYQGKGFAVKVGPIYNTAEIAGFNDILAKAKSLMIIPRDINEPL
jgi:hypothetical protein